MKKILLGLLLFFTINNVTIYSCERLCNLFKALCCCCCSDNTRPTQQVKTAARTVAIHDFLTKIAVRKPEVVRALYIYCNNNCYLFSPEIQDFLEDPEYGLADHTGNIRQEDQAIIRSLLRPNENVLDDSDWLLQQCTTDFVINFQELASELSLTHRTNTEQHVPQTTLAEDDWYSETRGRDITDKTRKPEPQNVFHVLHDNYKLIAQRDSITSYELAAIMAAMQTNPETLYFVIKADCTTH